MNGQNIYLRHTQKYLDLLERFMSYITVYKTNLVIPNKANIVIFDATDRGFSDYGLRVLNKLKERNEKNIVEVTKTGSKIMPWKIAQTI